MEMTRQMFGFSLGWLVTHRFDNRARLAGLAQRGGHAWIFHGTDDEVIPVAMSRTLAAENPATITCQEIPGARHNTLLQSATPAVTGAMQSARRQDHP